ncbi:hypothetical protein HX109_15300 [Galbibacter sp. BG1]|uniref:hypothetical protein n=1 Tax=Galbibacter sp. BG1 TaxID=1170699 RepID=UPI0015C03983|nr:hypothetical protein [Galbibacter sp. BG1]QLE02866.1 hypothetical protein HX109_15300 [Galbibacter sp. BG1]
MKNLILTIFMVFGLLAFGQKNDVLVTKGGELLQVKVTKVSDAKITYSYPGETALYEMGTGELEKVVFASGRTQSFSAQESSTSKSGYPREQIGLSPEEAVGETAKPANSVKPKQPIKKDYLENTVAIIPFYYEKGGEYSKDLSTKSTSYATEYISNKQSQLGIKVLPLPRTIDALIASGIKHYQIKETSFEDLQKAVGTQYILFAELNENASTAAAKKQSSVDSFYGTTEETKAPTNGHTKETEIFIQLYDVERKNNNDHGIEFSAKSPHNLGASNGNDDNWKDPLQYLLEHLIENGTAKSF